MTLSTPSLPLLPPDSRPRRVAIVTGSSQGLGLAIALRLADDGCDVVVNDLQTKLSAMDEVVRHIESKGARAVAVAADVSSEDEVKKLVEVTVEKFGKLDIVSLPFFQRYQVDSCLTVPFADGGERGCGCYEIASTKLREDSSIRFSKLMTSNNYILVQRPPTTLIGS